MVYSGWTVQCNNALKLTYFKYIDYQPAKVNLILDPNITAHFFSSDKNILLTNILCTATQLTLML